jgi:hypothetical protein
MQFFGRSYWVLRFFDGEEMVAAPQVKVTPFEDNPSSLFPVFCPYESLLKTNLSSFSLDLSSRPPI